MDSIYRRQAENENFKNDIPYFMDVVFPDQVVSQYSNYIVDGNYNFDKEGQFCGYTRHYHFSASNPQLVNNITFKNATQSVTSGSAITYEISAWNNVNDELAIAGIYVLEDSATPGQYTIGAELVRNVDYHITDNAIIIDGSVTEGLAVGRYGFFIKTVVPYLSATTGNYNYVNIIN